MDPRSYSIVAEVEQNHWWFAARRNIVSSTLQKFLPSDRKLRILEAGCGAGSNLASLATFGDVYALEPFPEAYAIATARNIAKEIKSSSLPEETGFEGTTFDAIAMLDVLEHIEDDHATLERIRALMKPEGILLLTVPAYMFLWSSMDTISHHKRRYSRNLLKNTLISSGFEVRYQSYFNTWLFPPIAVLRMMERLYKPGSHTHAQLGMPAPWLNKLLYVLFASECFIMKLFPLPVGVSLMMVATPRASSPAAPLKPQ